jgi:hypothetical protein
VKSERGTKTELHYFARSVQSISATQRSATYSRAAYHRAEYHRAAQARVRARTRESANAEIHQTRPSCSLLRRHYLFFFTRLASPDYGYNLRLNQTCTGDTHTHTSPFIHIVVALGPEKLTDSTLCCAVLCCAVLCCAVLCCAVLCCAVLVRGGFMRPTLPYLVVFGAVHPRTGVVHLRGRTPRTSRLDLAVRCPGAAQA